VLACPFGAHSWEHKDPNDPVTNHHDRTVGILKEEYDKTAGLLPGLDKEVK
jgi:hypothetical protein